MRKAKEKIAPSGAVPGVIAGREMHFSASNQVLSPGASLPSAYTRTFRDQRSANVFLPLLQVYETRLSLWTDVASTLDDFYYYYYVDDLELEILRN